MNGARFLRGPSFLGGLLVVGIACLATPAAGQTAAFVAEADVCEQLHVDRFSLVQLDLPADDSESMLIPFTLEQVDYLMVLDRHSLRSPGFLALVPGTDGTLTEAAVPAPRTYRGSLAERPDSRVAATLYDGQLTAVIVCADGIWGVQPLTDVQKHADRATHVVYRLEDLRPIEGKCGVDLLEPPEVTGPWIDDRDGGGADSRNPQCSMVCEIAFDADFEFYQRNGSSVADTVADIESVLNLMETIYERDTGIVYELTTVIVREAEPDPYDSTDPYELLDEFQTEWRNHQGGVVRDTAHLMTGKDLDGSVIGLAWIGVICYRDYGYGLSESRFSNNMTARAALTAHEVGHNWSAEHCDGDPDCYIMCSLLNGCAADITRFGSRSVNSIVAHRDSRACLTEEGPTILTQPTPFQIVCEGELVFLSISVDTPLPAYQWRRGTTALVDDGVHILGATTAVLLILDVTEGDAGNDYNCVVTDLLSGCESVSDYAEIAVDTDVPVITQQPQDQTATEGELVLFPVMVEGPIFVDYQWRKDGVPLSDGVRFFGTTTDVLIIYPVEQVDEGEYDCVVTSQLGGRCSTTSDVATLTVNPTGNDCPEDLNGDGRVDLQDLSQLLAHYGTTSGARPEDGDIDGDGDVDLHDLAQLLAVYGQDCPTR